MKVLSLDLAEFSNCPSVTNDGFGIPPPVNIYKWRRPGCVESLQFYAKSQSWALAVIFNLHIDHKSHFMHFLLNEFDLGSLF